MSRIAVTPADEDEVIVAGARVDVAPPQDEAEQVCETASEVLAEPESTSQQPTAREQQAERPVVRKQRKQADSYHETTLDDLESSHMPLAQRVVIIAAVVCIIGALVYYFVAMR